MSAPPGSPADRQVTPAGGGLAADVLVTLAGAAPFTLDVGVHAGPGRVTAVLGPNGSGKSTLLRALAGLVPLSGRVVAGGVVLDDSDSGVHVPTPDRRVGVVFQDYRLFPHLTVLDNVAFGAGSGADDGGRRGGRRAARAVARPWLARLGIDDLADRRPGRLSGGQAQRVALARALASQPRLLLLDEPLAALDARTRLEVRGELRRHLVAFGGASLLVTHDPLEALVLADEVLVLEHGRVVQRGTPALVARRPATEYVARLVGLNLYPGVAAGGARVDLGGGGTLHAAGRDPADGVVTGELAAGARMLVAVAPTAVTLHPAQPEASSARNTWPGTVAGIELLTDRVRVAVSGRPSALVDVTPAAVAELRLEPGLSVWLTVKATEVVAYPDPASA